MYIQICICMNSFANWEGVSTIFGLFLGESTFIDLLWRGEGGQNDSMCLTEPLASPNLYLMNGP